MKERFIVAALAITLIPLAALSGLILMVLVYAGVEWIGTYVLGRA